MTSAILFCRFISFFALLGGIFVFLSLALIFLLGIFSGWVCRKIHIPPLLGMIITGIIMGTSVFNLMDNSILGISSELRKIALIIILARAGLSLDINDLKKVGRPAVLMCFIPVLFEIFGMILIAPKLLKITVTEAAIMGAVVGAVSPAVIVPKMLKLMDEGYGKNNSIPQLILAGASVDDIFVIVMFTSFLGFEQSGNLPAFSFIKIPFSIILGILAGVFLGFLLGKLFARIHIRDTVKIILMLGFSFLFVAFEDKFSPAIPFSALIAVMCIGFSVQKANIQASKRLSLKYSKLWVAAEVMLFVLVGSAVDVKYVFNAGFSVVLLVFLVLLFRMAGVFICLIKTKLSIKERLFCMIAYIPKATVQAAIGGIPLSLGLSCGNIVLTAAILSILITAPLGAFLIDLTYKRLLTKK